jgi:hypothetical protein
MYKYGTKFQKNFLYVRHHYRFHAHLKNVDIRIPCDDGRMLIGV